MLSVCWLVAKINPKPYSTHRDRKMDTLSYNLKYRNTPCAGLSNESPSLELSPKDFPYTGHQPWNFTILAELRRVIFILITIIWRWIGWQAGDERVNRFEIYIRVWIGKMLCQISLFWAYIFFSFSGHKTHVVTNMATSMTSVHHLDFLRDTSSLLNQSYT